MKVLYYALGGGHGHALRGLAILRALRRRAPGSRSLLLAPARFAGWARQEGVALLSPPAGCGTPVQLRAWVGESLQAFRPAITIVDLFARGVLGELTERELQLGGSRSCWLLSRWVRPDYYLKKAVRESIERDYRGLIWCEPVPQEFRRQRVSQTEISPVLIRRPGHCLGRERARQALCVAPDRFLVLVLGSGDQAHQRDLLRLLDAICARLRSRFDADLRLIFLSTGLEERDCPGLSPDTRVTELFPAMRYLRAADLVVAAGGYHAFHETEQLRVPALFVPQLRQYDDQFHRVRRALVAHRPAELEQALAEQLFATELGRPEQTNTSKSVVSPGGADQVLDIVLG